MENLFPSIISDEENSLITSIPTPSEIKKVLFSFASLKSPGPDGLPPLFYKIFWKTTSHAVISAVQHFFKNDHLLSALNHTFIALIPKKSTASKIEHYRPISLCNVTYKIISKILANRLKPFLEKFISPFQMAFVNGRNIHDNIIASHEIMNYLHKKKGKKGFLAIKVDIAKAFDKVEWNLLLCILENLGFCPKFAGWIKECISTSSFSFLLNGSPFGMFSPSRGIRQGDPLSPFLFAIYMETLSRFLFLEELHQNFRGIKIARTSPTISHLLYADDLVVYCRATSDDVNCIKFVLNKFSIWSSQVANNDKSSVHFSANVYLSLKSELLHILNFKECNHKVKHLSLPFCQQKSKSSAFNDICLSINSKLAGWTAKTLSQAGRSVLVKAVAQAIPTYAMSVFILPKSICYKLDASLRKFRWGENKKGNALMLKCWDSLCLPKAAGGLGFRRMFDHNRALVSKLCLEPCFF